VNCAVFIESLNCTIMDVVQESDFDVWQVGETDEKLAEGIKLYAVSTVPAAKRSVLNDLIVVCVHNNSHPNHVCRRLH
jgi:hypothetical protein